MRTAVFFRQPGSCSADGFLQENEEMMLNLLVAVSLIMHKCAYVHVDMCVCMCAYARVCVGASVCVRACVCRCVGVNSKQVYCL